MEAYAGAIDYGALASVIGGVLTVAIMIWMAIAGKGLRLSGLRYLFFSQGHGIVYDGLGAAIEAAS